MNINPEYEDEYKTTMADYSEAMKNLREHLASLPDNDGSVRYPAKEEHDLEDAESEARERFHKARKAYFGDDE
jgi:hypothetical protein